MVTILSFDCGIKRLGVCCIRLNIDMIKECIDILNICLTDDDYVTYIKHMSDTIDKIITIVYMDNIDIIPGFKVNDVSHIDITRALHNTLTTIDTRVGRCDYVLIERQPNNLNCRSSILCGQILYHYICSDKCTVELVSPKLKNTISFNTDLSIDTYNKKNYTSSYLRNKAHARDNFKYYINIFGVDVSHIKKPLTDVADAFMQIFGWFKHNKLQIMVRH